MKPFKLFTLGIATVLILNCEKLEASRDSVFNHTLPSEVIDLENWKITIPFDDFGNDGSDSQVAGEIVGDDLKTYLLENYYYVDTNKNGVVFRAHAGGAHTSGSGYPRCELREMIKNKRAKWQSGVGKHTLEIEQAINHLPAHKKHVVAGQIHSTGDFDDVITCRLEERKLFLSHNGKAATVLTSNYVLGSRFKIKWVVEDNVIKSYFNDELVETYPLAFPDSYFKAGCYTQSASWGKNNNHNADSEDYGEVIIYKLRVSHI
ncbi:MAG: polysaccharide lyase family 7 protein [Cytophagales bacterium]|nr:polysaccharide lyase family 7 protein [Cytophagales bacterium]